uniref:Uncharacterized protein n=1 Tax=Rhizophora mucronata TaxID=61149 RepID=A0A2P2M347_RHIMU
MPQVTSVMDKSILYICFFRKSTFSSLFVGALDKEVP